jgi:ribosomal protein L16 Arg81 hydroxylase
MEACSVYVPTAAELIGDEAVFFGQYFNRGPFLRRDALRGDPRDVLSVADLDEVLESEAIRPPYLDVAKDGKQIPRSTYTEPVVVQGEYVTDRVVPERVAAHFRSGATLTWPCMNHHRPGLRALAAELSTMFAARSEVIAFLTPAGRRGLAPHYDPVDVFAVQLEGTKSWRVWPVPPDRLGDDAGNLDEAALGPPAIEVTLRPGDVLYMPYNCAHVAAALDQVSLHLSVTVAPRRWSRLLQQVVGELVERDPAFRGNPWLRAADTPAELAAMLATLSQRLSGIDPPAQVARLIADGLRIEGVEAAHHLRDIAAADAVEPDSLLVRAGSISVQVIERIGDKATASIGGAVYTLPVRVVDALDTLAGGQALAAGSLLPGASADLSTRTARSLVRIGVLRLV